MGRVATKSGFRGPESLVGTMLSPVQELIGMACVMWDAFALPWYLALYVREEDLAPIDLGETKARKIK
eukprot:1085518-Amphidinium_carterae.1